MSALAVEHDPQLLIEDPPLLVAVARTYGPLRAVTPEQAPVIRAAVEHDRSLLPRWQRRGDGVHEWAEPHHYARGRMWVRAGRLGRDVSGHVHWREETFTEAPHVNWRTREHWLEVVVTAAIKLRPQALATRRGTVTAERFRDYCRQLSIHGHPGTGRRCIVRVDRLAELLGVSKSTVQRCQATAEDLGLVVVMVPARMLNMDETLRARQSGSAQRGLANDLALVIPDWLPRGAINRAPIIPVQNSHDTPTMRYPGAVEHLQQRGSFGPNTRSARRKEPAPPAPHQPETVESAADRPQAASRNANTDWKRPSGRSYDPHAMAVARELVDQLPWLRGVQPGRLEPALRRFVRCRRPWAARDVTAAIDDANQRLRRASMTQTLVKNPPALLAKYLRDFDPDADHPRAWMDLDAFNREPVSQIQARNRVLLEIHRDGGSGVADTETRTATAATIRDDLAARRAARHNPAE